MVPVSYKETKITIQCFKYRQNQIPEAVEMKHAALETRNLATETQRKTSIFSKLLVTQKGRWEILLYGTYVTSHCEDEMS